MQTLLHGYNRTQKVNDTSARTCDVTLNITKDMDGPVYVYYELTGFYQNHRRCSVCYVLTYRDQLCSCGAWFDWGGCL